MQLLLLFPGLMLFFATYFCFSQCALEAEFQQWRESALAFGTGALFALATLICLFGAVFLRV